MTAEGFQSDIGYVFLCISSAKHWKCVFGRLEFSLLAILDDKLNRHLKGKRSCFTKDTRLDDVPRFLLVLFTYDCMHNKSAISQRFPITVHEQTICAKQSQYAWCFLEAFYLQKQKHKSYIHLYKCLSRVNGEKMSDWNTNQKNVCLFSISCWI